MTAPRFGLNRFDARSVDTFAADVRRAETLGHVLRGDLALVGPRPVAASEVAEREELRIVLDLVRPGATGPWRVHGREARPPRVWAT